MSHWYLIPLALFIGAVIPVQAGVNARLDKSAHSPVWAAALTTVVALLTMGLVVALLGRDGPSLAGLRAAPWWAWVGGAMGSAYVVAALYLAPRLGAASLSAFLVCGQLAAAVALDHFGAVGYEEHPVTWQRLAGLGLLVGGVVLVRTY
jgi:transporter family-2 protein